MILLGRRNRGEASSVCRRVDLFFSVSSSKFFRFPPFLLFPFITLAFFSFFFLFLFVVVVIVVVVVVVVYMKLSQGFNAFFWFQNFPFL